VSDCCLQLSQREEGYEATVAELNRRLTEVRGLLVVVMIIAARLYIEIVLSLVYT